ncbi:Zinc finger BED domain-containing protein 1 [Merluccius polli]|uniref:Zinc finger BED domain-containing protein 1 n=1 Tax=Merluccius polli TaxID=89951 RepID=A0AA47P5P3_MERPO|nr:Zinc finger BED domain-containing protein 1 [Merluccius polli]
MRTCCLLPVPRMRHAMERAHTYSARGNDPAEQDPPCMIRSRRFWRRMDQRPSTSVSQQLDIFLAEAPIPRGETALGYWRNNDLRFLQLAQMARKYLCAPCTSTESERLFSSVSHILDEKRNRLCCDKAEMLIFVKKNMHLTKNMAEAGAEAEPTKLISKKNSTSVIWQYFGFEATDEHQKQVMCQTCRVKVATSAGNTTNLHRHLRVHHLNLYEECMAKKNRETSSSSDTSAKQPTITSLFASVTPYEITSQRHKEITAAVTTYISKNMVSVNTVTKDAFKSLLRTMVRYVLPSRTYFNQVAIPQLYAECKAKVVNELENTVLCVNYRSVVKQNDRALHEFDHAFCQRQLRVTAYFPTDHTGENIAMGLRECLANWGLKEEAQTCITDNASNMVKAMELNQWTRLQCFGHRLHLAIGKYKNVCLCECVCLQSYYKCESLYYLHRGPSLCYIILPSNTEFTDALSGEDYVSVSYLKPVLHLLKTATLAETDQDTNLTKDIKSRALHYIEEKYSDPVTQELLDITSFLDPRFKTSYVSEENVPYIKDRVKMEMEQVAQKEQRACVTTHPMPLSAEEEPPSTSTKRKRSLGSFFKTKAVPASSTVQLEDTIKAELDNYLITPTIDGEQDPLAWWRVHNVNFPWLSKLARKYLCIPATSAPSERLFSASGNIVTCQRASLKPAKVDMLVFLAKNL